MSPAAPEFTPTEDSTTNRAQQFPQENVKIKGTGIHQWLTNNITNNYVEGA